MIILGCLRRQGVQIRDFSIAAVLRMARLTAEERKEIGRKTSATLSGRVQTDQERFNRAYARQKSLVVLGRGEEQFAEWLRARGLSPVLQKAVGQYNIDVAILPIAVEILHGPASPLSRPQDREKIKDLLNQNIGVLYVWVNRTGALTEDAAEYAVALHDLAKRDPSTLRQYRVIRGSGKLVAAGGPDLDEVPLVPAFGCTGKIAI
jgi:hypothetical protein